MAPDDDDGVEEISPNYCIWFDRNLGFHPNILPLMVYFYQPDMGSLLLIAFLTVQASFRAFIISTGDADIF